MTPDIVLNKKAYHFIFSTPEDYTFFQAFRRAQVLSNGGSEELVYNILRSKLRDLQRDNTGEKEAFWLTIIQFFASQPMFDYSHVPEIIDYIYNKKYQTRFENGRILPPELPDFSVKGRTIQALLRQSEEWHEHVARTQTPGRRGSAPIKSWKPFALDNYDVTLTNKNRYQIVQYTTSQELIQEGNEMRHCVASYAHSCANGSTSIWSLRQVTNMGFESRKMLTLEMNNNSRQIVQIRGKQNRKPDPYEMSILYLWANQESVSISKYF
jgi:hypothetical protein